MKWIVTFLVIAILIAGFFFPLLNGYKEEKQSLASVIYSGFIEKANQEITQENKQSSLKIIGSSAKDWKFTYERVDEINVTIEQINNTAFLVTPKILDKDITSRVDYFWKSTLTYDESEGQDSRESNYTNLILKQDQPESEIEKAFIITIPENITYFNFTIGEHSTTISAEATTTATAYGMNENICQSTDGNFHIAWIGDNNDLWYGNSSNNGASWSTQEISSAYNFEQASSICHVNGSVDIWAVGELISDYYYLYFSSLGDGSFTSAQHTSVTVNTPRSTSCVPDSSGLTHCCFTDSVDNLFYLNNTGEGALEINGDDSEFCDIEVNSTDDVHIFVGGDASPDDIDLMWSVDSFSTRFVGVAQLTSLSAFSYTGVSITIDDDDNYYLAVPDSLDLQYCNSTQAQVNESNGFSCQELDASNSYNPDIAVTEAGEIIILYQSTSDNSGSIYRANSSDGLDWEVRTELETSSGFANIAESNFPKSNNITDTVNYFFTCETNVCFNSYNLPQEIDVSYPLFSNYWDDNATLTDSGTGLFNVTVENTNGSVVLDIEGVNVTAQNITSNVYNASYDFLSSGTFNYRWHSWGNGTNKLLNTSEERYYTVNSSDTCTYSSGNWEVDCSDNCVIETSYNLGGNEIIFTNSGTFFIKADVVGVGKYTLSEGCTVFLDDGIKFG